MAGSLEPRGGDSAGPGPPAAQRRAVPDPRPHGALVRAARISGIVQAVVVLVVLCVLGLLWVVEFTLAGQRAVSNTAVAATLGVCAVLAVISLILAHAVRRRLRPAGDNRTGATTAGLVLGYLSTVLVGFGCLLLWVSWG